MTPADNARQVVLVEPGRLEIRRVRPPRPGPGELVLQIKCAMTCGTDLKAYRRGHPMWRLPTPFGHEFAGIVVDTGPGVDNFRPGDELMAAPTAPCGECFFCERKQENLCAQTMEKMVLGAYADYLLVNAHVVACNAFRKPADLPFEEAAFLEPLACVVHAQNLACPDTSESVLIIGAGPLGLLHMLLLRARGVREITIAGRGARRLEWARQLGADLVVDINQSAADQMIAGINHGVGPDLVIECTGQVAGWVDALARVRRGGRVVFFGGCPVNTSVALDTRRMHYDNLTLFAPFHYRPVDVRQAYELLCGRTLGVSRLVNARRPLDDVSSIFEMLQKGTVLKCAVIP
jgi:L-iditol 2-dehydrogenase